MKKSDKFRGHIQGKYEATFFDPDSSHAAWEHYKVRYQNWIYWEKFDINVDKYKITSSNSTSRIHCQIKNESNMSKEGELWPGFKISGDTDFNFNKTKSSHMKSFIKDSPALKEKLDYAASIHYTLLNFSIMPTSGALNNFKGSLKLDRFDIFIATLDQFYKNENEYILSFSRFNYHPLKNYLSLFHDVYDYCEKIYCIDSILVNKLLNYSKIVINCNESLEGYIDLALEYWDTREIWFLEIENGFSSSD